MSLSLKRWLQSNHLIQDAACGPNVCLFIIAMLVNLLWRHVVRSANVRLSILRLSTQNSGKTEIPKLDIIIAVEENIPRFNVSVQNFPQCLMIVTFLQRQYDLHEYLPYDILRHKVLLILALLDQLCHVSIFTVLHNYVQLLGLLVKNPKPQKS